MKPGSQRIAATTDVHGLTVSAFHDGGDGALVVVGVKEGGPNHVEVTLPPASQAVASWDLYMTTRTVDCVKTGAFASLNGTVELELPDEAVFTLVGRLQK